MTESFEQQGGVRSPIDFTTRRSAGKSSSAADDRSMGAMLVSRELILLHAVVAEQARGLWLMGQHGHRAEYSYRVRTQSTEVINYEKTSSFN